MNTLPFREARSELADALVERAVAATHAGGLGEDADRLSLIGRLQDARRARDISQRTLAAKMGTTQSAISALEAGLTDPQLGTVQRYARSMDLELTWKLRVEGRKPQRIQATEGVAATLDTFAWEEGVSIASKELQAHAGHDDDRQTASREARRRLELVNDLQEIRDQLEVSQRDLAKRLGIGQPAVSAFESGSADPRLRTVLRYAAALGVEIKWKLRRVRRQLTSIEIAAALMDSAADAVLSPILTALTRAYGGRGSSHEALVDPVAPLPGRWTMRLLDSLEAGGWARRQASETGWGYAIAEEAAHVIGLSLHRDRIQGVLANMGGEEIASARYALTTATRGHLLEVATMAVEDLANRSAGKGVVGVGVSVAGVVHGRSGDVLLGPSLRNPADPWTDVPFERELQKRVQSSVSRELRVAVENDANCLAISEFLRRGDDSCIVYLLSGVGIGAGMIFDGRLARGSHNVAGEVGHRVVVKDGPPCRIGLPHNGCIETVASAEGILREIGVDSHDNRTLLAGLDLANARVASGDRQAAEAFRSAGELLGKVLGATVLLLDPGRVAIYAHPQFADSSQPVATHFQRGVQEGLQACATERFDFVPQPVLDWQTLGVDSRARAAAEAALWHFLRTPMRWAPSLLERVVLAN